MGSLERRRGVFAGVLLGASVLGLLLTRGIPAAVRDLYPGALPAHPYFVPDHAVLLYLLLPVACLAAVTVLMLPGIFLVLAQGRDERLEAVVVKGLGVSLAVHFVTTALAKTFFPRPIDRGHVPGARHRCRGRRLGSPGYTPPRSGRNSDGPRATVPRTVASGGWPPW